MENRNIINSVKNVNKAIDDYSEEISDLRHTTSCIAHEVLSRPPSFWSENNDATLAVLRELDTIVGKRDILDEKKDSSIKEFSNQLDICDE